MRITESDLLLFKYLFECKFLSRNQVQRIWNRSLTATKNRLWKLRKHNFIDRKVDPLDMEENGAMLVTAKDKALKVMEVERHLRRLKSIKKRGNSKLKFLDPVYYRVTRRLDFRTFTHDYWLNELRIRLEDQGADYWETDYILKKGGKYKTVPDGIFKTQYEEHNLTIAIELERNIKEAHRYRHKFIQYYKDPKIDFIIYVAQGAYEETVYNSLFNTKIKEDFMAEKIKYGEISYKFYKKFFVTKYNDLINLKPNKIVHKTPTGKKAFLKLDKFLIWEEDKKEVSA